MSIKLPFFLQYEAIFLFTFDCSLASCHIKIFILNSTENSLMVNPCLQWFGPTFTPVRALFHVSV